MECFWNILVHQVDGIEGLHVSIDILYTSVSMSSLPRHFQTPCWSVDLSRFYITWGMEWKPRRRWELHRWIVGMCGNSKVWVDKPTMSLWPKPGMMGMGAYIYIYINMCIYIYIWGHPMEGDQKLFDANDDVLLGQFIGSTGIRRSNNCHARFLVDIPMKFHEMMVDFG